MPRAADDWPDQVRRFAASTERLGFWHSWLIGFKIAMSMLVVVGFCMFCGAFATIALYAVVAVIPAELLFNTLKLEDYWGLRVPCARFPFGEAFLMCRRSL